MRAYWRTLQARSSKPWADFATQNPHTRSLRKRRPIAATSSVSFEVHGVPGAGDDVEPRPGDRLVHRLGDGDELGVGAAGDDLHGPVESRRGGPRVVAARRSRRGAGSTPGPRPCWPCGRRPWRGRRGRRRTSATPANGRRTCRPRSPPACAPVARPHPGVGRARPSRRCRGWRSPARGPRPRPGDRGRRAGRSVPPSSSRSTPPGQRPRRAWWHPPRGRGAGRPTHRGRACRATGRRSRHETPMRRAPTSGPSG